MLSSVVAKLAHDLPPGVSRSEVQELAEALDPDLPLDWRALAAVLALSLGPDRTPRVLGVGGGQGAGKTTLSRALVQAFQRQGLTAAATSLDDFYLSRRERQDLARQVHPLFATRGVPGTHRVGAARALLDDCHAGAALCLPHFDKAADDPAPEDSWTRVPGPVQRLVFEGWCVGARPQPVVQLDAPLNDLERDEDPAGVWRRAVNAALAGSYQSLWAQLDVLLFLAVPDLAAVRRWRAEQEQQLAPVRRMSADQLQRFVAHYERLTRAMLRDMPRRADWCVPLGPSHRIDFDQGGSFRWGSVRPA